MESGVIFRKIYLILLQIKVYYVRRALPQMGEQFLQFSRKLARLFYLLTTAVLKPRLVVSLILRIWFNFT